MKDSLNIAIAGATGYVGIELIKILLNHSKAKILYLCELLTFTVTVPSSICFFLILRVTLSNSAL